MWNLTEWWSDLVFRARALVRRSTVESELDDEVRTHFERYVEKQMLGGASRQEAVRRARMEFGGLEQVKEECRDARGVDFLEEFAHDARFGLRMLRKSPGFAAVAILTLALGIGACSAVFSLVDGILLKPLPYAEAGRIVSPSLISPPGVNLGSEYFPWSEAQFGVARKEQSVFQAFGVFRNDSFNLTGAGEPAFLDGFRASADFFSALGIAPALGRTFSAEEDQPGHEHVVVLSDALWRERFGADRGVLGRSIELNGYEYTVVGVMPGSFAFPRAEEMPASFNFPREAQLWVPIAIGATPKRGPSEMAAIARLNPGVSLRQAQAQMDLVTRHAEAQDAQWKGWFNIRLVTLTQQIVGDTRRPLELILAAVGVVLLIACSNVANLLLSRALVRKKEFSLRAALGAKKERLVRQLVTEGLILTVLAGVAGVGLAFAGIYFVKLFGPENIPRLREVAVDFRVLAFALGVSLVTGVLFGVAPILGARGSDLIGTLKNAGRQVGNSAGSARLRNALLVGQVALAMVLVVSAGLLARTFLQMLAADGGFNADRVLTFQMSLPPLKYAEVPRVVTFYRALLERLRAIPGVESAGIGETVPMGGEGESTVIRLSDAAAADTRELPFANYTMVSPGYLSAVGTALLRGRDFAESDTADGMPVTIVNRSMAEKYWPGQDAIGKQAAPGSKTYPLATIVGIVADAKHTSIREQSPPEMYVLYNQKVWPSMLNMRVALRTRSDPMAITGSVREAVASLDMDLPLAKVSTLTKLVDDSMTQLRFVMLAVASFGMLALVLASIGMYGVISYSVSQRTREIGIRMALGAGPAGVFAMVLGQGARLAGLGIVIGFAAALGVTRVIASFLFGVRPTDPLTFAGVALLLAGVAAVACYLPARRATKVDPVNALRYE
jgi:predicted permease